MKVLTTIEAAKQLALLLGKPILYISFYTEDYSELFKAAPYLDITYGQILNDGEGFIVCDDREELDRLFDLTVGEDGPTESNPYSGTQTVYALTIDENGELLTENT